jgi:methyltransferase (TIGR00027 family)
MSKPDTLISNVTDTALWVAHYRAKESNRPDALFRDPLAQLLSGEQGAKIARDMKKTSRYTEWTVVMRTVAIDALILKVVAEGADLVINLGAGLDTRPYRMKLPQKLKWIEVDMPGIIQHKNNLLKSHTPACQLSRVAMDLSDHEERKRFLTEATAGSEKVLVLTEGVVIYLPEEQVATLAADLHELKPVTYWLVEYFSPESYRYLQATSRRRKLKNAPFLFFPVSWMRFFEDNGWQLSDARYLGEEGMKLGRGMPMPRLAFIFKLLAPKAAFEKTKRMTGFMLLCKKNLDKKNP